MSPGPVAPGGVLGILGGGQLGRMIALAAAQLGYRCHVFAPPGDQPASQVAERTVWADYDDVAALDAFCAGVDAVTLEFENVPVAAVEHVAARLPMRPGPLALKVAQDRLAEKDFINAQGIGTAPYRRVDAHADLDTAAAALGLPLVLKTRRLGYDGKGQALVRSPADFDAAFAAMAGQPAIAEGFVDFAGEASVVAARGADGTVAAYPLIENRHLHHILDFSFCPAAVPPALAAQAAAIAGRLLAALDYVGVMAVEFFLTRQGGLLVNEIAPRVHNSGHGTIEGAQTSQFEQAARAALGLPLGSTALTRPSVMMNLIGEDANAWPRLLAQPGTHLHLYGKAAARPGRKMGHATALVGEGEAFETVAAALKALL